MIKSLIAFAVCASIAVPTLWYTVVASYKMDKFASEAARTSLEVTEEQSAELNQSALRSDAIVFAAWGAALAACIALCCAGARNLPFRFVGVVVGLLVGAGAGWATANLGFWFDHAVKFEPTTTYWAKKWGLMYLPIAGAVSISAIAAGNLKNAVDCIVGAVVGSCLAVFVYCILLGLVTPLEGHDAGFPGTDENRLVFLIGSFLLVGGGTLILGARTLEKPLPPDAEESS